MLVIPKIEQPVSYCFNATLGKLTAACRAIDQEMKIMLKEMSTLFSWKNCKSRLRSVLRNVADCTGEEISQLCVMDIRVIEPIDLTLQCHDFGIHTCPCQVQLELRVLR